MNNKPDKGQSRTMNLGMAVAPTTFSRSNKDKRIVELAFSSETPCERSWGIEILDHSPNSIDLSRLKAGGPVLMDHNSTDVVGVVDSVHIGADRVGRASVRFSRSKRGQEVYQDIVDGIRTNISVGYLINDLVSTESDSETPTYRVTRWQPYEISIVSVPADPTVGVGRSASPSLNTPKNQPIKETTTMQNNIIQNRNFADLIANARPEQIPVYDEKGDFKTTRFSPPSTMSVRLDDNVLTREEGQAMMWDGNGNSVPRPAPPPPRLESMTTENNPSLVNSSKPNTYTWKHMILASGILARAGTSFDTSGNFEGNPFFPGFGSHFVTAWLGENAEIPESTASTVNFPYSIHTVGTFSLAPRRFVKLAPYALPQVKIGQGIAIKNAVEEALIAGDSATNANQPDGLVKQVTEQTLAGASKTGLVILSEVLEVLEGNGLDKDALSVVMSPDVAKKFRQETGYKTHPALSIPTNRMLVSKFMPSGTLIAGRYSDYQAVTSSEINFLAHTYTPAGQPETGATRIRSLFDVDAKVLNQESFVKVTGIA